MDSDAFEASQREREWFHDLRIPAGMWAIIRVDGRSFTKLTADLEKPFDERFSGVMCATAEQLLSDLGGVYAYTESDEISVVLPPSWDLFGRSVEKTVSLSAGIASVAFSFGGFGVQGLGVGHFDSRVWIGASEHDVIDYMSWRQADAARCALNGWCYWTLRRDNYSARSATSKLAGVKADVKHQLLHDYGINFNDLPLWQRRGVGLWLEDYEKVGHNPVTSEDVTVTRRRVRVERELPMKDEYRALVSKLLGENVTPSS